MNAGFFSAPTNTGPIKPKQFRPSCHVCRLYKTSPNPKQSMEGKGEKRILIITNTPATKKEGSKKKLEKTLSKFGVDLVRDCKITSAVQCACTKKPTADQIDCCRPRVWDEIKKYKPALILILGTEALSSFISHRIRKEANPSILKWRGWRIPDRESGAWVCPTYSISRIKENDPLLELIWKKDIERAIQQLSVPFKIPEPEENCVEVITNERLAKKRIEEVLTDGFGWASFDYETTGLKPHAEGHRIVCASVCVDIQRSFAFPMTEGIKPLFKAFLQKEAINKMAHNMKFEDAWSNVYLKTPVKGWVWDSMIAAHILDNRKKITGLKFQTYVNFGVPDYSSHIEPFLESVDPKNANGFNRVTEVPIEELLLYCGLDSLFQFRLSMKQIEEMSIFDTLF